jgi:hypothetical protein
MFYVCTLLAAGIGWLLIGWLTAQPSGHSLAEGTTLYEVLWLVLFGGIYWHHKRRIQRRIALALQEQMHTGDPREQRETIAREVATTGHSTYLDQWERYKHYLPQRHTHHEKELS